MSDQTGELAEQAAEAVRSLSDVTCGEDAMNHPSDVSEIVASLQAMAGQMPQLFAHLASWLIAAGDSGRIEHDGADTARGAIGRALLPGCPRRQRPQTRWCGAGRGAQRRCRPEGSERRIVATLGVAGRAPARHVAGAGISRAGRSVGTPAGPRRNGRRDSQPLPWPRTSRFTSAGPKPVRRRCRPPSDWRRLRHSHR